MKGLFQCPPWARSFCPFRACGAYLRNLNRLYNVRSRILLYNRSHKILSIYNKVYEGIKTAMGFRYPYRNPIVILV